MCAEFLAFRGQVSLPSNNLWLIDDVAGQFDVYVRPFPEVTGGKWPVSTNGGSPPLWARSGKELFEKR